MTAFLVMMTLLLPSMQDAQQATQAFDDATLLLTQGRYEEALAMYDDVQTMGVESAALWHNMGIAHYRLNHLGYAILYFERAARMDAEHEAVKHSLRVARERQVDSFSSLPRPFWRTAQAAVLNAVPPRMWFTIGLVLLYAALLLYLLTVYGSMNIRMGRSIPVLLPVLAAICILVALSSSMSPPQQETAIIVVPEATLREQADSAATSVRVVHEGLSVDVRTRTQGWALIQISNGTRGWVPSESLESL